MIEYLESAGFQPGSISLETVNMIVSEISEKEGLSFLEKLDTLNLTSIVKNKLVEMNESGYIENLQLHPEFQNLASNEKEFLLTANEMLNEFSKAADDGYTPVPCPGSACTVSFILVGAAIGSGLCGFIPCGVVGGVIGLIIGTSIKP